MLPRSRQHESLPVRLGAAREESPYDSNRDSQIKPSTSYVIDELVLTGSVPATANIVDDGPGGSLTIGRCSRSVTTRVAKGTKLLLGAGCKAR